MQLKMIHKTLEQVLTHGPEFEALLMTRPEVQRDEKWAWLWDPRSPGGVWYRWRLWEVLTGSAKRKSHRGRFNSSPRNLFEDGTPWQGPEDNLRFEFTTAFEGFVSDSDYSSADEDSGDERPQRRFNQSGGPPNVQPSDQGIEQAYLNPLQKAKLAHLLARLPTTTGKLRKGDVARVTAFAIRHAGEGADEVVEMIVSNIEKPFAWSGANPERRREDDAPDRLEQDDDDADKEKRQDRADDSSSKLIALYLVSDILSSSSTSGVRHAWRYRQLFENALAQRRIFERLGRLEKDLQWGRLRAEKWRRSVSGVLALWEGWCVFPQAAQERFVEAFTNPPVTEAERREAEREREREARRGGAARSKWKTVDVSAPAPPGAASGARPAAEGERPDEDVEGEGMADEDVDGEPMEEDLDGEPLEEDVDGEPMEEDAEGAAEEKGPAASPATDVPDGSKQPGSVETAGAKARLRRPKAIDMFADSDEE